MSELICPRCGGNDFNEMVVYNSCKTCHEKNSKDYLLAYWHGYDTGMHDAYSSIDEDTIMEPIIMESTIIIPENLDTVEFFEKWVEWCEYRKKTRKKKVSNIAAIRQLKKLSGWGVERAIAAIENSIENDYQGIFEPKQHRGKLGFTIQDMQKQFDKFC